MKCLQRTGATTGTWNSPDIERFLNYLTQVGKSGSIPLQQENGPLRQAIFFYLRILSVYLFNQIVLDSHLLDLVELSLDKIYMSFLFLEN